MSIEILESKLNQLKITDNPIQTDEDLMTMNENEPLASFRGCPKKEISRSSSKLKLDNTLDSVINLSVSLSDDMIIGSGTYSTVYKINGKIARKVLSKNSDPVVLDDIDLMEICVPYRLAASEYVLSPLRTVLLDNSTRYIEYPYYKYTLLEYCVFEHISVDKFNMIIRRVVHALSDLHSSGFSHGDVCELNILLNTPDDTVLADFGLCQYLYRRKFHDANQRESHKSIEQIFGHVKNRRDNLRAIDAWALGITIIRCLYIITQNEAPDLFLEECLGDNIDVLLSLTGIPDYVDYRKLKRFEFPDFREYNTIKEYAMLLLNLDPIKRLPFITIVGSSIPPLVCKCDNPPYSSFFTGVPGFGKLQPSSRSIALRMFRDLVSSQFPISDDKYYIFAVAITHIVSALFEYTSDKTYREINKCISSRDEYAQILFCILMFYDYDMFRLAIE